MHHTEWICQENKHRHRLTDGNIDRNHPQMFNAFFLSMPLAALAEKEDTISTSSRSSTVQKNNTDEYLGIWYRIVGAYSGLHLTISSDRVLAISGIATRFEPLLNDNYCAGHWRSRLHKELLWRNYQWMKTQPRPSEYQAPSWSWASISTSIETSLMHDGSGFSKRSNNCFEIFDCQIRLWGEEERPESTELYRFGAVRSGTLVLKGRMQQATLWRTRDDRLLFKIRRDELGGSGALLNWPFVWCDALEEESANKPYNYIPIFLLRVTRNPWQVSLILRQKGPSIYSRLGIIEFEFDFEDIIPALREQPGSRDRFQEEVCWLDAGEVRTIAIV